MAANLKAAFPSIRTEPFALQLLQMLQKIGFKDPILFGGSLRDHHLGLTGKIHDYDIQAGFGTILDPQKDTKKIPDLLHQEITHGFPGAEITLFGGLDISDTTGHIGSGIVFIYEGREITLYCDNMNRSLQDMALHGDAPINSVAMDSNGTVVAHPDFLDHITRRLYKPFGNVPPERAEQRYKKFQEKIPGLSR